MGDFSYGALVERLSVADVRDLLVVRPASLRQADRSRILVSASAAHKYPRSSDAAFNLARALSFDDACTSVTALLAFVLAKVGVPQGNYRNSYDQGNETKDDKVVKDSEYVHLEGVGPRQIYVIWCMLSNCSLPVLWIVTSGC